MFVYKRSLVFLLCAVTIAYAVPMFHNSRHSHFFTIDARGESLSVSDLEKSYFVTAERFGAKGDGATDDTAALDSFFAFSAATHQRVFLPNATFFSATGVRVPAGADVAGLGFEPGQPWFGAKIVCAASLAGPCITMGTEISARNTAAHLDGVIAAFNGIPVPGDTAWLIQGYNDRCDDLGAYNTWDGFTFAHGIAAHCRTLRSGVVFHDHLVVDGFPEVYISQGRFGNNGAGDRSAHAYVSFTGNDPNTFECDQCQFNQGSNLVGYFLDFHDVKNNFDGLYKFIGGHVEDLSAAVIHADRTTNCYRCTFDGLSINAPSVTFFSLPSDPAPLYQADFHDSDFFINDITIPSDLRMNSVKFTHILGMANLNVNAYGSGISDAVFSDISVTKIMKFAGSWNNLWLTNLSATSYSDATATGKIFASGTPNVSWSPSLRFSVGASGLSFASTGTAHRSPDGTVAANFQVGLSAIGNASGPAVITGFPYTCANSGYGGFPLTIPLTSNFKKLSGIILANLEQGTSSIRPYMVNPSNSVTSLDASRFTNSSNISGSVSCMPR